jgi:hypothetical protein
MATFGNWLSGQGYTSRLTDDDQKAWYDSGGARLSGSQLAPLQNQYNQSLIAPTVKAVAADPSTYTQSLANLAGRQVTSRGDYGQETYTPQLADWQKAGFIPTQELSGYLGITGQPSPDQPYFSDPYMAGKYNNITASGAWDQIYGKGGWEFTPQGLKVAPGEYASPFSYDAPTKSGIGLPFDKMWALPGLIGAGGLLASGGFGAGGGAGVGGGFTGSAEQLAALASEGGFGGIGSGSLATAGGAGGGFAGMAEGLGDLSLGFSPEELASFGIQGTPGGIPVTGLGTGTSGWDAFMKQLGGLFGGTPPGASSGLSSVLGGGGVGGNFLGQLTNSIINQQIQRQTSKDFMNYANQAMRHADPLMQQQRQPYQQQLLGLMSDPQSFSMSPAAQAQQELLNQSFQANAAKYGPGGTVNIENYLKPMQNLVSQDYYNQANLLSRLGGFDFGGANAGVYGDLAKASALANAQGSAGIAGTIFAPQPGGGSVGGNVLGNVLGGLGNWIFS